MKKEDIREIYDGGLFYAIASRREAKQYASKRNISRARIHYE